MCSSCGGKAKARLPGATAQNPVIFGEPDARPSQPVTLLEPVGNKQAGTYLYAGGDGVEKAVKDGKIKLGYDGARLTTPAKVTKASKPPPFYVQTGEAKWIGFRNRPAAERYAKTIGGKVQTRAEVVGEES